MAKVLKLSGNMVTIPIEREPQEQNASSEEDIKDVLREYLSYSSIDGSPIRQELRKKLKSFL